LKNFLKITTALLMTAAFSVQAFAVEFDDIPSFDEFSGGLISDMNPARQSASAAAPAAPVVVEVVTPVYVNPLMSHEPYVYIKGGLRFTDFNGLPDFAQFARIDGWNIATYPQKTDEFYNVGRPNVTYTYKSIVRDYIGVSASSLSSYKSHIKSLGFTNQKTFSSKYYREYIEQIQDELRYDVDFKLDRDGIYMVEDLESFYWLLIGKSITYDADNKLVACVEFRFYSLTRPEAAPYSILDEAGHLNDAYSDTVSGAGTNLFTTPNAIYDIKDVENPPSGGGLTTPSAINDIR